MRVTNIVWNDDGADEDFLDLPTEMEVPDELYDGGYDDEVADYLSEQTGYCVEAFCIED